MRLRVYHNANIVRKFSQHGEDSLHTWNVVARNCSLDLPLARWPLDIPVQPLASLALLSLPWLRQVMRQHEAFDSFLNLSFIICGHSLLGTSCFTSCMNVIGPKLHRYPRHANTSHQDVWSVHFNSLGAKNCNSTTGCSTQTCGNLLLRRRSSWRIFTARRAHVLSAVQCFSLILAPHGHSLQSFLWTELASKLQMTWWLRNDKGVICVFSALAMWLPWFSTYNQTMVCKGWVSTKAGTPWTTVPHVHIADNCSSPLVGWSPA